VTYRRAATVIELFEIGVSRMTATPSNCLFTLLAVG
jgi:hypothetical protein